MKKIKTAVWGLGRAAMLQHIPETQKYPDLFEMAYLVQEVALAASGYTEWNRE